MDQLNVPPVLTHNTATLLYCVGIYDQSAASTHPALKYVDTIITIAITIAITITISTIIITNKIDFQSKAQTGQTDMLFCCCDLDLMTLIYENVLDIPKMYLHCQADTVEQFP